MVRAYDRVHLMELDRLDLAFAQREMFESAVAMGKAALKVVGVEAGEVERVDREYRSRDCERLERQSRDRRPPRRDRPQLRARPPAARRGRRRHRGHAAEARLRRRRCPDASRSPRRSLRPRRRAGRRRCGRGCAPRHRTGAAPPTSRSSVPLGSSLRSSGRVSRRPVRSASTSTGASSQTVIERSLSSSRVRGST